MIRISRRRIGSNSSDYRIEISNKSWERLARIRVGRG